MTNCTRLGKMMAKMGLFFSASLCRRHAATLLYYGIRNGVRGFLILIIRHLLFHKMSTKTSYKYAA
jgi:hypothetical protein